MISPTKNIYTVIIGSELLNGRRVDSHFEYANRLIVQSGHKHKGSFIIGDDRANMESVFSLIKQDENAIVFSFGGIGATPDDITREVASYVFTGKAPVRHLGAEARIIERFKEEAYPYRILMAQIPEGSMLLENVVTKVPGFYLFDKFYFMPGFPNMAHPMLDWIFAHKITPVKKEEYAFVCVSHTESELIPLMNEIPVEMNLSSLPKIEGDKRSVVLSISHVENHKVAQWFEYIVLFLERHQFKFKKGELC